MHANRIRISHLFLELNSFVVVYDMKFFFLSDLLSDDLNFIFCEFVKMQDFYLFFCFSSFLTIQPLESIVWLNLLLVFCIVSVCVCSFANLLSSAFYSDDHHHDHGHGWFVSTFVDGRSVGWLVVRNI